jgi:hypothetical protein
MMHRILNIKFLAAIFGMSMLSACDHYLSENPDNRVELNTVDKCAKLLTNAYSAAGYTFTEWMGDNVSYTVGTQRLTEHNQMYNWQDPISVNQDTPTNFWQATYEAIAHANEVLAVIDNLDEQDHARKNAVKAEALLTRAYGHFMLVNLFAKAYDPQTASSDPGIPYVLEPETVFIKKYERNTVKEVYSLIETDLKTGLKYVSDSYYANSGKYHFTVNAALAFATRFYLFKGDYSNCIKYSTQMLGADPSSLIKDLPTILEQTLSDNFSTVYSSPTDQGNIMVVRQVTNFPVNVGYWPDSNLLDSIFFSNPFNSTDDYRYRASGHVFPQYIRGANIGVGGTNFLAFAKYQFLFERSSITSNVGLYYTIMPVFRGEEVLLSRAEAYIMQNQVSSAIADLQVLVAKRYEGNPAITTTLLRNHYSNATNNQQAALSFVVDERRKEFIQEGMRWYDVKRFHKQVSHILADHSVITLSKDDPRKILQIPQAAIDIGGLEANPR